MITKYQKQWGFLARKFESGNLAHAFLFSGQDLGSITFFAKEFVKFLNCSDTQKPCGQCQNCKLIEKVYPVKSDSLSESVSSEAGQFNRGAFPDLFIVKSANSESSIKNEKDMMEIDVAQIREVNNFLSYKSYYGNCKIVIIENVERMNLEAQSCFLKTLEEPKGKTLIILITKNPEVLLPTIFSRCQTIKFFPFEKYKETQEEQETLQELLSIINSELATKFQYTKRVNLEGDNFNKILEVLQRYFRNLMLIKMGVIKQTSPSQFNNCPILRIKNIIRLIETLNTQISTTNASPKLALEILLMEL